MNTRPVLLPILFLTLLSILVACRSIPAAPAPTTLPAQADGSAQVQDAWAQVRASLPSTIPVYRPTFVPERFGAPQLLEARVDETYGPLYTILYSAPDENLAFILNMGKGALGNFPPPEQREPITIDESQGELLSSLETNTLGVFWQTTGENYQITAYSSQMTKEEMTKISESVTQQ